MSEMHWPKITKDTPLTEVNKYELEEKQNV